MPRKASWVKFAATQRRKGLTWKEAGKLWQQKKKGTTKAAPKPRAKQTYKRKASATQTKKNLAAYHANLEAERARAAIPTVSPKFTTPNKKQLKELGLKAGKGPGFTSKPFYNLRTGEKVATIHRLSLPTETKKWKPATKHNLPPLKLLPPTDLSTKLNKIPLLSLPERAMKETETRIAINPQNQAAYETMNIRAAKEKKEKEAQERKADYERRIREAEARNARIEAERAEALRIQMAAAAEAKERKERQLRHKENQYARQNPAQLQRKIDVTKEKFYELKRKADETTDPVRKADLLAKAQRTSDYADLLIAIQAENAQFKEKWAAANAELQENVPEGFFGRFAKGFDYGSRA